jgi:hypothetical protein
MVQRPGFRNLWLYGAVMALAIQGVMPVPQDLVSGSITTILRCILSDRTIPEADDSFVPGEDGTEDPSAVICAPPSSAVGGADNGRRASPGRWRRAACIASAMGPAHPGRGTPPLPVSTDRRFASLGRLTC